MSQLVETAGLQTAQFDYDLPEELIAQVPLARRDASRLLVLERTTARVAHHVFADLPTLIRPGDLLVANRTRVLPARLTGRRIPSGGRVEALLLRRVGPRRWEALVRPGRRLQPGARVSFDRDGRSVPAQVGERLPTGGRILEAADDAAAEQLVAIGALPLPPYVKGWNGEPERYQTIYGDQLGSAAAPTAGLHFTPELLAHLRERGVGLTFLTLHVGVDTFRPIRAGLVIDHEMHAEWAEVPAEVVQTVAGARDRGGRVIAVGTTTVRALESAALWGGPDGWSGETRLFIAPGHPFRQVDAMITNFHFPRSSLLVLVSAFAGRELTLSAYRTAVAERYRFYSFGDAMLIL